MENQWVNIHKAYDLYGSIEGKIVRIGLNQFGKINRNPVQHHYEYGRATGGFGCKRGLGHAIFVHFIGKSIRDVKNREALKLENGDRWENDWPNLEVYTGDE